VAELKKDTEVIMLPKNKKRYPLAPLVCASELHCHCTYKSCHFTLAHRKVIAAVSHLRIKHRHMKVVINSFFRCQKHNEKTKGSSFNSNHTKGLACDFDLNSIDKDFKDDFIMDCGEIFDYIVVNEEAGYIHCQFNF